MTGNLGKVHKEIYDNVVKLLHDHRLQQITIARQLNIPQAVVSSINAEAKVRKYKRGQGPVWTPGPGFKPKKKRKSRLQGN